MALVHQSSAQPAGAYPSLTRRVATQQPSPRHASRPSFTASAAITGRRCGSSHHAPTARCPAARAGVYPRGMRRACPGGLRPWSLSTRAARPGAAWPGQGRGITSKLADAEGGAEPARVRVVAGDQRAERTRRRHRGRAGRTGSRRASVRAFGGVAKDAVAGETPDDDRAREALDGRVQAEADQRDRAGQHAGEDRDGALQRHEPRPGQKPHPCGEPATISRRTGGRRAPPAAASGTPGPSHRDAVERRASSERPASVSAYMTILPSRRAVARPAARSARSGRRPVLRPLAHPGQVANAQLPLPPSAAEQTQACRVDSAFARSASSGQRAASRRRLAAAPPGKVQAQKITTLVGHLTHHTKHLDGY